MELNEVCVGGFGTAPTTLGSLPNVPRWLVLDLHIIFVLRPTTKYVGMQRGEGILADCRTMWSLVEASVGRALAPDTLDS